MCTLQLYNYTYTHVNTHMYIKQHTHTHKEGVRRDEQSWFESGISPEVGVYMFVPSWSCCLGRLWNLQEVGPEGYK